MFGDERWQGLKRLHATLRGTYDPHPLECDQDGNLYSIPPEALHRGVTLIGAGDHQVVTPATGQRLVLYRYKFSTLTTGVLVSVKLGATTLRLWDLEADSERLTAYGQPDEALIVTLATAGTVRFNYSYKEIR